VGVPNETHSERRTIAVEQFLSLLRFEQRDRLAGLPGRESLIQEGHLGLTGMAERAQLFGGQLEIQATPGQGTTIDLRLNIIQNEEAS